MHGSFWQQRWLLGIGLILIASLRIGVLLWGWDSLENDPDAYRALAATWHDTGTYGPTASVGDPAPTAYRPPLYPWLLSWVSSNPLGSTDRWWIATLHVALGMATCLLTLDIAKRLGLPRFACWLATLWVACDPILLRQSTLVMTETTATCLSALVWWWWLRNDQAQEDRWSYGPVLVGVGLGLAVLCRPTALAWMVVWWGAAMAMRKWRWVMGCSVGVLLTIAPWTIRNALQFGVPIATTTHGGYTLYLANNPVLYDHWRTGVSRDWDEDAFHAQWRRERSESARQDEVALDQLAQSLAWSTIMRDPAMAVRGCAIRTGWLWALWPSPRQASITTRIAIAAWYAIHFGLAAVGLIVSVRSGKYRSRWLPGLALVISLTMVHAVYWSNMRMRAPAAPVLSLLAGTGWVLCWSGRGERKGSNPAFPA